MNTQQPSRLSPSGEGPGNPPLSSPAMNEAMNLSQIESKQQNRGRSPWLRDFTLQRHRVQGEPCFEGAQPLRRCSRFSKVSILENPEDFFEDAHPFPRCAPKTAHLRRRGEKDRGRSSACATLRVIGTGSRAVPWYNGELVFLETAMAAHPEPSATRRDFLTGSALRRQVEHAGGELADAIVEGLPADVIPQAGPTTPAALPPGLAA